MNRISRSKNFTTRGTNTFMTACSLLLFALSGAVLSTAATADDDGPPGYDDGPMLPDSTWRVHDVTRPQPPKVTPGCDERDLNVPPVAEAIVLFDGTSLNAWQRTDGAPINSEAAMEGNSEDITELVTEAEKIPSFDILRTSTLRTKSDFGDCQLHLEWCSPTGPEYRMNWGNSGVFMMGQYEIQIIESHDSFIYADGNAGAIYGQFPPIVNPARAPGEWQSFDIYFTAPRFDGDQLVSPPRVTVMYNGFVVQLNQEILGGTLHRALPAPHEVKSTGPIELQSHGSAIRFRNIWLRPLERQN